MSIGAGAISDAAVASQPTSSSPTTTTKKTPRKRVATAIADTVDQPEAR